MHANFRHGLPTIAMMDNDASFELCTVRIPSKTTGWNLDAWKYTPEGRAGPHPVIIMAHGFSANKKMGLAQYAVAFAGIGYAVVVFDYRRFGDSDGKPRECVYVSEQLEDYRTVIAWVRQQEEFDGGRVVIWGTSFAGGHAVILSSEKNLELVAAISQCPYVGKGPKIAVTSTLKFAVYGVADHLRQLIGLSPLYIPASAEPGTWAGMNTSDAIHGMELLVKDKQHYPNRISASSMFQFPSYNPMSSARKIANPLLLIYAEHDQLCRLDASLAVANSSDKVEAIKTPGGHFDLYSGGPDHEVSLKAQIEFLRKHVPIQ